MSSLRTRADELLASTRALTRALEQPAPDALSTATTRRNEAFRVFEGASPERELEGDAGHVREVLREVLELDARISRQARHSRDDLREQLLGLAALRNATRAAERGRPPRFVSRRV